jgi:hypothetical protein
MAETCHQSPKRGTAGIVLGEWRNGGRAGLVWHTEVTMTATVIIIGWRVGIA